MKKFIPIICIMLIASALRLYQLGAVPSSPDWDEVSLGYNAYSILKTGRDEFGTLLPFSIRSFNDYKPPLYTYVTIPSVALFGLNVMAVRLPSAMFGILAVLGVYFLVHELLKNSKLKSTNYQLLTTDYQLLTTNYLPSLSALLLAISPWHIQFSRAAFEANLGVTCNIWALYFLLKGVRQKGSMLIASGILWVAGLYAYHAERIFIPLLLGALSIIFHKELLAKKKELGIAIVIAAFIAIPLMVSLIDKSALSRLGGTSTFRKQTEILTRTVQKLEVDQKNNAPLGLFLNNRRWEWGKSIAAGYLAHFSFKWLFLTGDHARHHAPDMGLLYIWELPLILLGIVGLIRRNDKASKLTLVWLLIAPIPAAFTYEVPHAIRSIVFLPAWQIIGGYGLVQIISWLKNVWQEKSSWWVRSCIIGTIGLSSMVILFICLRYLSLYFIHMNIESAQFWQYGYKQLVTKTESMKGKYESIVVSESLEQPYIFYLFYLNYDPATYLKDGGSETKKIGSYVFRPLRGDVEIMDGKTLFVGSPKEILYPNIETIMYPNGEPAMLLTDKK